MSCLLIIFNFITILVATRNCFVFAIPQNVSCIYHLSLRPSILICQFLQAKNGSDITRYMVNRKIYVHQSSSNNRSDFYKHHKGQCPTVDRGHNYCTYFPTKQEFHITADFCEGFLPFQIIVEENDTMTSFSITPCNHGQVNYDMKFIQNKSYSGFQWQYDSPPFPNSDLHNLTYEFYVQCLPLNSENVARTYEKIFEIYPEATSKMLAATGLTAGTNYSCVTKSRYKRMSYCSKNMICTSEWYFNESGKYEFRTADDAPSSGPLFYKGMYQVNDGFCYIYFLPMAWEYRNGIIQGYECISLDGHNIKTSFFNFKVECPNRNFSCSLYARNRHGRGSVPTEIDIHRENDVSSELELWKTNVENLFKVKVRFSKNLTITGLHVIICKCRICNDKHPDCIFMEKRKVVQNGIISVNLNSERVSVMAETRFRLLPMTEWVNCSYSNASEMRDITSIMNDIRTDWKMEGNQTFLHVDIPTASLKCDIQDYRFPPINGMYVKQRCPQKEDIVRKHSRRIGQMALKFDIEVFKHCIVLLSVDGKQYFKINKDRNENSLLFLVFGLVAAGICVVCLILVLRKCFRCQNVLNRINEWRSKNFEDRYLPQNSFGLMNDTSAINEEGYDVIKETPNVRYSTSFSTDLRLPNQTDGNEAELLVRNVNYDDADANLPYTSQNCEFRNGVSPEAEPISVL